MARNTKLDDTERQVLSALREQKGKRPRGAPSLEEIAEVKDVVASMKMTRAELEEAQKRRGIRLNELIDREEALKQVSHNADMVAYMKRKGYTRVKVVTNMIKFVRSYVETGTFSHASDVSGVGPAERQVYQRYCAAFQRALDEAYELVTEDLEFTAHKRAMEKSDTLLKFLLQARNPAKYRNTSDVNLNAGQGVGVAFTISESMMSPEERVRAQAIAKGDMEMIN